jgi:hypothetical protein
VEAEPWLNGGPPDAFVGGSLPAPNWILGLISPKTRRFSRDGPGKSRRELYGSSKQEALGRISNELFETECGMLVSVDDSRRRMVCSAERFGKKALGRGPRPGLAERRKSRVAPVESTKVTPLAFHPDVGQSPPANCRWSV